MRDNYTPNALEAIRLAKSASKHSKQNYTGSEHLLLGLVAEPDGVASKVLRENNCTLERLNDMIAQLNIRSANLALLDHEGFSPRCQKIMRIAASQAEKYHSDQIGTEHLLLAIITEGENIALKLIETLGINPAKVYYETLSAIGENPADHKEDLNKNGVQKEPGILSQYSRDLTLLAQQGKLDPVIGRQNEINRMIAEAGVKLLLHSWVTEPIVEGNKVKGVIFQSKSGRKAILSKVVIDASGDGDMLPLSGAKTEDNIDPRLRSFSISDTGKKPL